MTEIMKVDPAEYRDTCRVLQEARRWGVPIRILTEDGVSAGRKKRLLTDSPGTHFIGICWEEKYLWAGPNIRLDEALPFDLLHELMHIVIGVSPFAVEEIRSGMLALEHEASKRLRLSQRSAWMRDYNVVPSSLGVQGDETRWPFASKKVRSAALWKSRQAAILRGLMTLDGRPTYKLPKGVST